MPASYTFPNSSIIPQPLNLMALAAGQKIGAYEIVAQLGAGGMGEVYRARDSRLKREVAIKVLPADVANDRERLARFQREAEVLASLNHPHIAHVYGIEENALVMELVEGEDLAQRIARGPIPIDEALPIVRQIAEALEAAHDAGIIHRDLKPANIKVRDDGTVKVLDFGLAKALDQDLKTSGPQDLVNSPTITSPAMTMRGVILGTAAYMAPEQAKGKVVDKRADIWAFGCVLFEMLTGKRAFRGDDTTDIITSVMRDTPDWHALPPATPSSIRTLLRRCVEKDPRKRAPHIGIARLEIDEAMTSTGELAGTPAARRSRTFEAIAIAVIVVALAVGWASSRYFAPPATPSGAMYLSTLILAENLNARPPSQRLALSPDGRRLVYAATDGPEGRVKLFVRSLDRPTSQVLAGSENAIGPFWSADGRFVAFYADGELKKIDIAGGPPITITSEAPMQRMDSGNSPQGMPGSWNADDVIVYSSRGVIRRISVKTGESEPVTRLDESAKQTHHDYPHFLPDGRHFLYAAFSGLQPGGTFVGSIDGAPPRRLLEESGNAQYGSGHLLFVRGTTLMAQPFDPDRLEFSGDATPIVDAVQANVTARTGAGYAVSRTGTLVYQAALGLSSTRLLWSTRTGQQTVIGTEQAAYRDLALSPDGTTVAITPLDERGRSDIWLVNLVRGGRTRLTSTGAGLTAVWSPDGKTLAYSALVGSATNLYRRRADGAGAEELRFDDTRIKTPTDWSPDGKVLLFDAVSQGTLNDIMVLDASGKATTVIGSRFAERWAQFSPDGKWIAYTSDESGTREVFVTRYSGGGRWQVSTGSGNYPRWSRDQRELFFHSASTGKMMAARITTHVDSVEVGVPVPLFDARAPDGFARYFYDVAPDGRFLLATPASPTTMSTMSLVVNWQKLVEKTP
jgi:eukaryotic-like serine/threonine-protein kinase